jgi:hypothetical protein
MIHENQKWAPSISCMISVIIKYVVHTIWISLHSGFIA